MKTLIRSLVSGLALCAMAVALNAQTPATQGATPETARAAAPVTICGACGEQIHPAAPVYVAQPVNPQGGRYEARQGYPVAMPGQSFYGMPPVGFVPPPMYPYGYCAPGYRVPVAPRSVLLSHGPAVVAGSYPYPVGGYYPQGYCR